MLCATTSCSSLAICSSARRSSATALACGRRRMLQAPACVQPPLSHGVAGHPGEDHRERDGDIIARAGATAEAELPVGDHDQRHDNQCQGQRGEAGLLVACHGHQVERVRRRQEDQRGKRGRRAGDGGRHGDLDGEGRDRAATAQRDREEDQRRQHQLGRQAPLALAERAHEHEQCAQRRHRADHGVDRHPVNRPHPLGQRRAGRDGRLGPSRRVRRQGTRLVALVRHVAF